MREQLNPPNKTLDELKNEEIEMLRGVIKLNFDKYVQVCKSLQSQIESLSAQNEILEKALNESRIIFNLILVEPRYTIETKYELESILERDKRDARNGLNAIKEALSKLNEMRENK